MLRIIQLVSTLVICILPIIIKFKRKPETPRIKDGMIYISISDSYYYSREMPKFAMYASANVVLFFVLVLQFECNLQGALESSVFCLLICILPFENWNYKEVAVTDTGLWISDYINSITVSVNEIKKVGERRSWMFIKLKTRSLFGKTIVFAPVDSIAIKKLLEQLDIECKLMK